MKLYDKMNKKKEKINLENLINKGKKEKITIFYTIKDNSGINIFGYKFYENNKNNCELIIKGKEYKLFSYYNPTNDDIKKGSLEIILKGIDKITNASHMFHS